MTERSPRNESSTDLVVLEAAAPRPRTREEVHHDAMARGADCTRCPLYGCDRGPVMGTILPGARLIAIGEAPGCFVRGTRVRTPSGTQAIETLRTGDEVLGGDGRVTTVVKTFSRPYEGLLYHLRTVGGLTASLTPEHPVWAAPLTKSQTNHSRRRIGDFRWVPARELSSDWAVYVPWSYVNERKVVFDLTAFKSRKLPSVRNLTRLAVDDAVAFVLGMFVGDGSAACNTARGVTSWHLNTTTKSAYAQDAVELANELGLTYSERICNKNHDIRLYSTQLHKFFRQTFYAAQQKVVPKQLLTAPISVRQAFVRGWLVTDGKNVQKPTKPTAVSTSSLTAACALRELLLGLRICPCVSVQYPSITNRLKQLHYTIGWRDVERPLVGLDRRHNQKTRNLMSYDSTGAVVPIRSVTTTTSAEAVFNIETGTNDYCVPFVVHNSNEVTQGRGFVGASGRVLDDALEAGGLPRSAVSVTNVILCMPPDGGGFDEYILALKAEHAKATKRWERRWGGDGRGVTPEERTYTAHVRWRYAHDSAVHEGRLPPEGPPELHLPQEMCRARLWRDIEEANATVILAVGSKALEQVTSFDALMGTGASRPHVASLKKQHGAPVVLPTHDGVLRVLVATYHPAFAMRERCEYMPVIRSNITRAARIALRGGTIDWHEPPFLISPDADLCVRTLDRFLAAGAEVAVDIETDSIDPHTCKLRCVGLAAYVDGEEVVICIPFRRRDGGLWWSDYDVAMRIALKLREVLDTLPLIFQNGQYDTTVLLRVRLMTNAVKTYSDCYLEAETEFLTDRGWLRFDDVRDSDRLATTDKSGRLEYQRAIARTDTVSKEPLYCFETRTTRTVVTGNHRMWVQPYARGRNQRGSWGFRRAESLLRGPDEHFFRTAFDPEPYNGDAIYEVDGVKLDVYWMTLLGLFLSDGSIVYQRGKIRGLVISQQQDGKASKAFDVLQRAFLFRKTVRTRAEAWRTRPVIEETWRLCRPDLACQVERWCGRYSADKHLPAFTFELPSSLRLELLENLLLGDSSETNGRVQTYRSISKALADGVQVLALSVGRPATMRMSHVGQRDQTYDVRIVREQEVEARVQTVLKKVYANGSWRGAVTRVGEAGARIVCFTVPNETLVTRNRGNPAFHGNTLLYHHNSEDNDLPHDLGFLARRFFEAPLWKENIDHKSVSSQSDYELHEYNARDVLVTLRLMGPLREAVDAAGTESQNETDRRMAVRTREMSELGLVVNEWLRGKFSKALNRQCYDLVRDFQALVGKPVNPRSPAQLQELFYVDWGYQPVIATDGYEWEVDVDDVSDGSTSNAAITQLMDLRAPHPRHVKALEKLLEFRANDKIRGTYTDNLRTYDFEDDAGYADAVVAPVWDEQLGREVEREVIPRRRALTLARTTYKGFVVPTGRLASGDPINCFAPDTEVLTRCGWVLLPALPEGEEVAQFDPKTKAISFVVPERTQRHYSGDLIHAYNTAIDLLCTPDHRLLFYTPERRRFYEQRADARWPSNGRLQHAGEYAFGSAVLSAAQVTLLAACQADGSLTPTRWDFGFVKVRKADRLRTALNDAGVSFREQFDGRRYRFYVSHITWLDTYLELPQKHFRLDQLLLLSRTTVEQLCAEFFHWDGCITRQNHYSTNERHNAEIVAVLHLLIGRYAKTRPYQGTKNVNWQVDLRQADYTCSLNMAIERVPYDGTVYCLRVPTSFVLTRRNRKPLITGQCQNIPARARGGLNLRSMYTAPLGYVLVGADFNQIELRLYAIIAQDRLLLEAIRSGLDAHTLNAASMLARPGQQIMDVYHWLKAKPKDELKYLRTVAKRFVFALIYGGKWQKIYQVMVADRDKATGKRTFPNLQQKDCQEWEENWHRLHPETRAWHARCHAAFKQFGFTGAPMLDRRKRFFPGGVAQENAIPNLTIQTCVPFPTRVLTDRGYSQIGQLRGCKFLAWTGTAWAPAVVLDRGPDPLVTLTLSDGKVIQCDTRHQVRVPTKTGYEWRRITDVTPGDVVALNRAQPLVYGTDTFTDEDAYWLGYHFGNGYLRSNRWTFTIGRRQHLDFDVHIQRLVTWLTAKGAVPRVRFLRTTPEGKVAATQHATHATITAQTACARAASVEFGLSLNETAHTKRISDLVWSSSLRNRRQFLRGFYDADFGVQRGILNTCNRALADDLYLLGQTVGLKGRLSGPYMNGDKPYWRLTWEPYEIQRHLGIDLDVRVTKRTRDPLVPHFEASQLLQRSCAEVKRAASNPGSAETLYYRVKSGGSMTGPQLERLGVIPAYDHAYVESIDVGEPEEMYTLSVDHPDHAYVAEGLISRNSAASIANRALLAIAEEIPYRGWSKWSGLVLQVHDYIGAIVPETRYEEAIAIIERCMLYSYDGMVFDAQATATWSWGDQ